MKTIATHGTFEDVLAVSTPEIRALAQQVRALIIKVMPDVVEVPWPRQRIAGYGVGPKKMSEHFCYIAPQQGYVNLGFNYGAELPDPEGLLEGSGKLLRHTKITALADIERPALRRLLEVASKHRMPEQPSA